MVGARRLPIAAPFIALLGLGCVLAANATLATIEARRGPEGLREALALTPSDASIHEQLAVVEARSAASPAESQAALDHASRAVALRPTSPYAWATLADVRYRTGVADATFVTALQRASELGPHEPAVQEAVASLGLAVWDTASPQARASVDRMLAAGARRDPGAMVQIARRRGRLDAACRHVGGLPRIPENLAQICKSTEAK